MSSERVRGAVRLFRWWYVEGLELRSSSFNYRWVPGENVSKDLYEPMRRTFHVSFDRGGDRFRQLAEGPGFYGFLDFQHLMNMSYVMAMGGDLTSRHTNFLVGSVLGFGKVTLHEKGARCERAVIESLMVPAGQTPEQAEFLRERTYEIAGRYGVLPVTFGVLRGLPGGVVEGQAVRL